MKQTTIAAALISVLVLVTATVSVAAGGLKARELEFGIDHYKCYKADHPPFLEITGVTLADQFDVALDRVEEVGIFLFMRFCNPAGKLYLNKFTPSDPNSDHLTFYFVNPAPGVKQIQGSVVIANQFGQQELEIRSARMLAVPTFKEYPGNPDEAPSDPDPENDPLPGEKLDHYKCYYATGQAPDPGVVGLFDQFATHTLYHQLGDPVLFCNPVLKDQAEPKLDDLHNPDDHLTCYHISELTAFDKPAWIYNQFTPRTCGVETCPDTPDWDFITATEDDLLCVPSKKVSFRFTGEANLGTSAVPPEQCIPGDQGEAQCAVDTDCPVETHSCELLRDRDCACVPRE